MIMRKIVLSMVLVAFLFSCEDEFAETIIEETATETIDSEDIVAEGSENTDQSDSNEDDADNESASSDEDGSDEGENESDGDNSDNENGDDTDAESDHNSDEGNSEDNTDDGGNDESNDDDDNDTQEEVENGVGTITSYLLNGTWQLTQYIQKTGVGVDNRIEFTEDFSALVFDFDSQGNLRVSKEGNVVFETAWLVEEGEGGFSLNLDFDASTDATLNLLTNDWDLVFITESRIGAIIGTLDITNKVDNRIFLTFERI